MTSEMSRKDLEHLRFKLRAMFPPISDSGPVFMDNAGGSLLPLPVISAVTDVLMSRGSANSNFNSAFGQQQMNIKNLAHEMTALYFNAPHGGSEVALGASSTILAFRLGAAFASLWGKGDAVVVSQLEHECNASPWRALQENGVEIRVWNARWPSALLDVNDLAPLLADGKVKLVAVTAASNTLGVLTPYKEAAKLAHAAGAWICVDWVHLAVHALPNVQRDDIDFMVFSPYKVFAPHLGCLYIRSELIAKLNPPTLVFYPLDSISKFELGTPPFESLAGWIASLKYIAQEVGGSLPGSELTRRSLQAGYDRIAVLEAPVSKALVNGLSSISGVQIYGDLINRVGTVAFTVEGRSSLQVAQEVCKQGVFINSGHFYATMCVEALGLMPEGVVRASIVHYNSEAEVQKLIECVRRAVSASKL